MLKKNLIFLFIFFLTISQHSAAEVKIGIVKLDLLFKEIPIYKESQKNMKDEFKPKFTTDAITALTRHNWPGNVRELKNLIERACILFQGQEVTSTNVTENLLRLKAPNTIEEQNEIWDVTSELMDEVEFDDNDDEETIVNNLPHPNNYKDWFTFYDEIDIRPRRMDSTVDGKTGRINTIVRLIKFFAVLIHLHETGGGDLFEEEAIGIEQEGIRLIGNARRNMRSK